VNTQSNESCDQGLQSGSLRVGSLPLLVRLENIADVDSGFVGCGFDGGSKVHEVIHAPSRFIIVPQDELAEFGGDVILTPRPGDQVVESGPEQMDQQGTTHVLVVMRFDVECRASSLVSAVRKRD
jgi:hypothetical protein